MDKDLEDILAKASRQSDKNRSKIAREALRRQLRISQFDALRRRIVPFAEARGYLTDEDDAKIVATAVNGGADVLLTGDTKLLALSSYEGMGILSPRQFWQRLTADV